MTIAAAIVDGTEILAGADSAASGGTEIYTCPEEKIFVNGSYLFGYCGSYRIGQILRYRLQMPDPPSDGKDLTSFLVCEFIPLLRNLLQSEGAASDGREFLGPKTTLIVGCQGQLWGVSTDLMVVQTMPHVAIGSGRQPAYGAFHALELAGVEPAQRRLELALSAAAEYTTTVRRPFRFVTLSSAQLSLPALSPSICAATRSA